MIKLTFTGDLMVLAPQNKVSYNAETGKYDYSKVFSKVSTLFKDSDYVVGNLETPVAGEKAGYTDNPTIFNTPREFLENIVESGFSHVTLANNHILDKGIAGMRTTIQNVRDARLDFSGAYENSEEADNIFIKEIKGIRIAILAFTYGTNSQWRNNILPSEEKYLVDLSRRQDPYKPITRANTHRFIRKIKQNIKGYLPQYIREKFSPVMTPACVERINIHDDNPYLCRLEEKIQRARREADVVIMCLHSGGQYNSAVDSYTQEVAQRAAHNGCSLVVVNHPHCVLEFNYVEMVPVSYSLGNFCFTPNYGFWHDGVLAEYSVIQNVYIDRDSKQIIKLGFSIAKCLTDNDGHSIVWPVNVLYRDLSLSGKKKLYKDCLKVLSRLHNKKISEFDIERNEEMIMMLNN